MRGLPRIHLHSIKPGSPSIHIAKTILSHSITREMRLMALNEQTTAAAVECVEIAKLMLSAWVHLVATFKKYDTAIQFMESAELALKKLIAKQRTRRLMAIRESKEKAK